MGKFSFLLLDYVETSASGICNREKSNPVFTGAVFTVWWILKHGATGARFTAKGPEESRRFDRLD
jgi:ABC-type uncharacterized transport system permease subunit